MQRTFERRARDVRTSAAEPSAAHHQARSTLAAFRLRISNRVSILFGLVALAGCYGLVAGLRTVSDPDVGWQIATGRWILHHRQIPSSDVLSHTVAGAAWIYPALSQVLLYLADSIGGFALLSWMAAVICVVTVLLIARRNVTSAVLALLAVPIIAARTDARAEMFTEVLFAAFVVVLWAFHQSGRSRLWLLPPMMLLWVNLHLGFIAGLGMCAAYVGLELIDGRLRRGVGNPAERLRKAALPLAVAAVATVVNPWGPAIYASIYRQAHIMRIHRTWITEWRSVRVTPATLAESLDWRDPHSAFWWLLLVAVAATVLALFRRRPVAAVVLAMAAYLALDERRLMGPFAIIIVVIGGDVIHEALCGDAVSAWRARLAASYPWRTATVAGLCISVAFVCIRITDAVTNRYYLRTASQMAIFGAGEAPWYPEEAAQFLADNRLPAYVFNDFTVGGFFTWKLSPDLYRDYIDGRSVPFSADHFFRSLKLVDEPFESPDWRREIEARHIQTVFLSLHRVIWGASRQLSSFCRSSEWRPVYLDAYGAVFVRVLPENDELIQRLAKDCDAVWFPDVPPPARNRSAAQRFDYHLNAAMVLMSLERYPEVWPHLAAAEGIFDGNTYVHYLKGVMLGFSDDLPHAEAELRRSLDIDPNNGDTAYALVKLLENEGRWDEAEHFVRRQIELTEDVSGAYLELGAVQLALGRPDDALSSFAEAERHSVFRGEAQSLGAGFYGCLHAGRAEAFWRRGELTHATESIKTALSFAPGNQEFLTTLTELERATGAAVPDERTPSASPRGVPQR